MCHCFTSNGINLKDHIDRFFIEYCNDKNNRWIYLLVIFLYL